MAIKTPYHTRQQEEILKYLRSTEGTHHTALQIKEHFAQNQCAIGTATIYRQLEKLVSEGTVRKYALETGDSACYEFVENPQTCEKHFHCKCERCGNLIHLDCEELRQIRAHLLTAHGFQWNAGKTVFYGLCEQCRHALAMLDEEGGDHQCVRTGE